MLEGNAEAGFIDQLIPRPRSVLDAGCGTGRVAVELARQGYDVVGVDISTQMLLKARRTAPDLRWRLGDIARVRLERRFDAIVIAGNVMIYLVPGTESLVLRNMALHLAPGGRLITGFFLSMSGIQLDSYDNYARRAGLQITERYAGWDREPWHSLSNYVVSVHTMLLQSNPQSEIVNPQSSRSLAADP